MSDLQRGLWRETTLNSASGNDVLNVFVWCREYFSSELTPQNAHMRNYYYGSCYNSLYQRAHNVNMQFGMLIDKGELPAVAVNQYARF